jgi:hypothetical protein
VGTLSYILSFAMGAGPVPGLLVPEITAARIRGKYPKHGLRLPLCFSVWCSAVVLLCLRSRLPASEVGCWSCFYRHALVCTCWFLRSRLPASEVGCWSCVYCHPLVSGVLL